MSTRACAVVFRWLLFLCLLLLCFSLASCARQELEPSDRTIDMGSHALHVRTQGEGSPAVVIDVGIAARLEEWQPLQARLAGQTRVILYDRAGYGGSEAGPLPRDSRREMDELKNLLEAAAIPGPYVLVGHSLGALNLQIFAARYPEDVAALVLLDPPPLGWLLGENYPELRALAEEMTAEWQAIADRGADAEDPAGRTEAAFFQMIASEHREMLGESARRAAAIESFGDTPLLVIGAGVANPFFGDVAEEYQQYWIAQNRALAARSSQGRFVLAADSSHRLHKDAADLVFESIRAVLAELGNRDDHH